MNPADRIGRLTGASVTELRVTGGQHLWRHYRGLLADGRQIFAKLSERHTGDLFRSEAGGLRWLSDAHAVPVPDVLAVDDQALILTWIQETEPTKAAADQFGTDLARLHQSGAGTFGAPWPGFIASLPQDNAQATSWPEWYATRRLAPFLKRAADRNALAPSDVTLVDQVIARIADLSGPPEPPARIHGDLWSGNLIWGTGRPHLVDPAAHGGHRESDLAMLALFGAPHLERILQAYDATAPLADGWQSRVSLRQLHPLLVHACLFGATYASAVRDAASSALRA
jgi:fructosamine-3-kinase